jgi:hypothetical protein
VYLILENVPQVFANSEILALRVISTGRLHLCGDGESDMSQGLCAARVAIAANMEANVALVFLLLSGR